MEESIKEVLVAGTGATAGSGAALGVVYTGGVTGLSTAPQIASGLKAVGSLMTGGVGGMAASTVVLVAAPIVGGVIAWCAFKYVIKPKFIEHFTTERVLV